MADRGTKIEVYAFLSDTQTGALVSPQTNITHVLTPCGQTSPWRWANKFANIEATKMRKVTRPSISRRRRELWAMGLTRQR